MHFLCLLCPAAACFAMQVVKVNKAGILNGVFTLGSEKPYQTAKKCIEDDRLSNNLLLLIRCKRETKVTCFSGFHSGVC